MDTFEKYLTLPGKTDPPLTIFEHSTDVLQVTEYFLRGNSVENSELLKLAALLHDVGKIEQAFDETLLYKIFSGRVPALSGNNRDKPETQAE